MLVSTSFLLALAAGPLAAAITLDLTSADSIKAAAGSISFDMMSYYTGNHTGDNPGNLPAPYYWWEAGSMFGHMVDYWYYTGDTSNNEAVKQAITWQAGVDGSFMPANESAEEGNDDQVFWSYTAMNAAELNFEAPGGSLSWVAMAQAVFNTQAARWDPNTCGGGLRWQIFPSNGGYNEKNTVANGGLFFLAARLARYTGNSSYVDWAEKTWDWFSSSVLYDPQKFAIFDIASTTLNCTQVDHTQWSYNYAIVLGGLAYIYNHTNDEKWMTPLKGILTFALNEFFPTPQNVMIEITCEPVAKCDNDQLTFKSYMMRWLAITTQLVPALADQIWPYLQASGQGAAGQCDGGSNGRACGFRWNSTAFDGLVGVGQQMSALAAVQANMLKVASLPPPYTVATGGTSKSDGAAGSQTDDHDVGLPYADTRPINTSDRAGAGILTALAIIGTLFGAYWILSG